MDHVTPLVFEEELLFLVKNALEKHALVAHHLEQVNNV